MWFPLQTADVYIIMVKAFGWFSPHWHHHLNFQHILAKSLLRTWWKMYFYIFNYFLKWKISSKHKTFFFNQPSSLSQKYSPLFNQIFLFEFVQVLCGDFTQKRKTLFKSPTILHLCHSQFFLSFHSTVLHLTFIVISCHDFY